MAVIYECSWKAREFVPGKLLQPSLAEALAYYKIFYLMFYLILNPGPTVVKHFTAIIYKFL
jgi:hypothetical protein